MSKVLAVCAGLLLASIGLSAAVAAEPTANVAGDWVYAHAKLVEADGKTYNTSVSGGLKLSADGKFEQSRRIGTVLNPGKGTYSVKGDELTLKYTDGSKTDRYRFTLGKHKEQSGQEFVALTLRSQSADGSGFEYLLTRAK